MLGSVKTLMFVVPPALAGADFLFRGNLVIGAGLLCVALGIAVVHQYVLTPSDLPVLFASKFVNAVVGPPDEE